MLNRWKTVTRNDGSQPANNSISGRRYAPPLMLGVRWSNHMMINRRSLTQATKEAKRCLSGMTSKIA